MTLLAPTPSPAVEAEGPTTGRVPAWCLLAVDGCIGFLAGWTIAHHVALALDWDRDPAGIVGLLAGFVAVLAVGLGARRPDARHRGGEPEVAVSIDGAPRLALLSVLAAGCSVVLCASVLMLEPQWWVAWAGLMVSVVASIAMVTKGPLLRVRPPRVRAVGDALGATVAIAAVAMASLFVIRPDSDDVFLLNTSLAVEADGGPFPSGDTIFGDELAPTSRPPTVPSSVEALVGFGAAHLGVSVPTLAHLVLGPLVAGLGVCSSWALAGALGARRPGLVAGVGAAFCLLDGVEAASFGNFTIARTWQGKVILLAVILPAIWRHGLDLVRRPSSARAGLGIAIVAGVGCSSTGVWLAPVVASAAGFGAWVEARDAPAPRVGALVGTGLLLALVYPLATMIGFGDPLRFVGQLGGVSLGDWALGDRSPLPGLPPDLTGAWPWYKVLGPAAPGAASGAVVMLGWMCIPRRGGQAGLVAATLMLVIGLAPGVLRAADALLSLGSVSWRLMWLLPLPTLVGMVASEGPQVLGERSWRGLAPSRIGVVAGTAVLLVHLLAGRAVWHPDNGATVAAPAWDIDPDQAEAAETLLEFSRPGDLIAAPIGLSEALAVQTVEVRTVLPRWRLAIGSQVVDRDEMSDRAVLTGGVAGEVIPAEIARAVQGTRRPRSGPELLAAADRLGVDVICMVPDVGELAVDLVLDGWIPVGDVGSCRAYRRT